MIMGRSIVDANAVYAQIESDSIQQTYHDLQVRGQAPVGSGL